MELYTFRAHPIEVCDVKIDRARQTDVLTTIEVCDIKHPPSSRGSGIRYRLE
ncbi:hypothetical protein EXIGLDRAFT_783785 [Exidia glandulosa HHB12029]|uniref:Uncharacterized protein n=1 Tax=Exidia glandulosa HHB12029 TaxID=1314781 RepID=A0A166MW20_EXIGL|nr:hypothetical protein EXIGLDRAFT_783785 [Exidia glandulosa HHB12029]